jgi:hypothetical protein
VAYLLGVEAYVVGVGEHLLEDHSGLSDAARSCEGFYVPERAEAEGALAVGYAVRAGQGVAVDQAVGDQLAADLVQGGQESRVCRAGELDQGHDKTDASSSWLPGYMT